MNNIILKFKDLHDVVNQLDRYRSENITLTLLEPEEDVEGDMIPATLILSFDEVEEYIESIRE